jgi:hypothetical protein
MGGRSQPRTRRPSVLCNKSFTGRDPFQSRESSLRRNIHPFASTLRFLRFIVEQEIAGQADQLKEYVLGLQVLGKDESFDPRIDTSVRTEVRRLRQKLAEYYQFEGRNDSIEIAVPKGSYRAVFSARPEAVAPAVIGRARAGADGSRRASFSRRL